jgi:hypothetical protein
MGRSWQFFLTIAIVVGVMGYLYYSSDFYAERSAAGPTAETQAPAEAGETAETAAPAEGGVVPPKE